jgi:hypothetical protein
MAEALYVALIVLGVVAVPVLALSLYFGLEKLFRRRPKAGSRVVAEGDLSKVIHGEIIAYTFGQSGRPETMPVSVFYFTDGSTCLVYGHFPGPYEAGSRLRIWREGDDLTRNLIEVIDQTK